MELFAKGRLASVVLAEWNAEDILGFHRFDAKRHERHHEHVQKLRGQQKEPKRNRVSLSSDLVRHERSGEMPRDHARSSRAITHVSAANIGT